jgi:hypothetical protein
LQPGPFLAKVATIAGECSDGTACFEDVFHSINRYMVIQAVVSLVTCAVKGLLGAGESTIAVAMVADGVPLTGGMPVPSRMRLELPSDSDIHTEII